MEAENRSENSSSCSFSTPDVSPPEDHDDSPAHHTHRQGTVTPNRIFVGGIDYKVNERDLRHIFSRRGAVKDVKIVIDRFGMSKGYGFVTFETQDDALKVLHDANGICFKDKKLIIGQAVRKRQASGQNRSALVSIPDSAMPLPMSCGSMYLTTSAGCPYTYHNGVAYFHCPNMSPPAHHWPPAPPVMLPQSHQLVYQQPTYHHQQCVQNQYQWNVIQPVMPSSPAMYPQQSEYLYQSTNGDPVQPPVPVPVMEDTTPEFVEPTVLQVYPVYPPRTEGMRPIVLQHGPGKLHLKPKYRRYVHHEDYHYPPEAAEPTDASVHHAHQPVM